MFAPILLLPPPVLRSLQPSRFSATRCFSGAECQVGGSDRNTTSGDSVRGISVDAELVLHLNIYTVTAHLCPT